MANKTALQTLIEWGDKMLQEHPMKLLSFAEAIDKADRLLEMEKKQLIDAYTEGYDIRDNMGSLLTNPTGEQYYNETYKGSKQ